MRSPRRIRRRALSGALAAGAALAVAGTAAAAEPQLVVPAGSGVTTPSGAVKTPDGSLWVADHILGFCRVVPGTPGHVDATGMPWCGAGDAPVPPAGPVQATNLAFDAAAGEFVVAGANGKSGGIWTIPWSPLTGIDALGMQRIITLPNDLGGGGEIVEGMAYTPNEQSSGRSVVDFTTKRKKQIFRIENPLACAPSCMAPGNWYSVGATAAGGGPVATIGGRVYVGEITGLASVTSPPSAAAASGALAAPVPNAPAGQVTGLAVDRGRDAGRLYVGTFGVAGGDTVWAMAGANAEPGTPVPYATGFGGVQGLNAMADGSILVGDDPTVVAGTAGSASSGRIWEMAATSLDVPRVTITRAPRAAERQTSVNVEFSSRPGVAFECRIDPPAGDLEGGWEACGSGPTGSRSWSGLGEGAHRIEVRAVDPDPLVGTGPRVGIGFAVDLTAPSVRIENGPGDHRAPLGALDMRFSSDEIASFECGLDAASLDPCESPERLRGIATGAHVFHVRAVDGAGNTSPTADWAFTAGTPPTVRVRSLAQIARGPVTARARIAGRSVIVRIPAPRGARYGRIIIERKGVRRADGLPTAPRTLVWTSVRLRPGAVNAFRWTPGSRRLGRVVNVRSIHVLVRVGPAARRLGPGRAAILTSRGPLWATGPAVTGTVVKGGSTR